MSKAHCSSTGPVPPLAATKLSLDRGAPYLRSPEKIRHVYGMTLAAALLPLIFGVVLFGWRAAMVSILSVFFCVAIEKLYYRVTQAPAMLGRSHAYLTGVLLALTLPPFTPWYVVLLGAAFAILVGKAIFGGVGHFLWQPALVGRFAVAVIMPILAQAGSPESLAPPEGPVLARGYLLHGDCQRVEPVERYQGWSDHFVEGDACGFAVAYPAETLAGVTRGEATCSALAVVDPELDRRLPVALAILPPMRDMLVGTRPGGIGETCAMAILVAGIYLIYRNYVRWQLPVAFLVSAALVAAIAPVQFVGHHDAVRSVWFPFWVEGSDVGITYINYQLLSGQILIAAFFFAPEMTSSPVTPSGQMLFGMGCGTLAMLFQLYMPTPIPAYFAVLVMNTFVPTIDAICRPRIFGYHRRRFVK